MDETKIKEIIEATGLPSQLIQNLISERALLRGISPRELTLEDFKEVLVQLLQDVFTDIKDGRDQRIKISD
ncbi:MAG: hypothetical protein KDD33_04035 [Bdellovibrionales bacterium]|nr:hypothetical protein [Bdellovibrionales bacterium]